MNQGQSVWGPFRKKGLSKNGSGQWVVQVTTDQMSEYHRFLPPPQEHHEEDFFLYIAYSDESVYGL